MGAVLTISTPLAAPQVCALEQGSASLPDKWRVEVNPHLLGAFRVEVLGPGYRAVRTFELESSAIVIAAFLKVSARFASP